MIEILYLGWNRLEFTQKTFETMLRNTDWSQVSRMVLYDDGSSDGTCEFLREARAPVPVEFRQTPHFGPVGIMNDYFRTNPAAAFAKVDNDTMLPPEWLSIALPIFERENLDLLGIEARGAVGLPDHAEPTHFIGGIGLMRKRAFIDLPKPERTFFGFTHWQEQHEELRKGWLEPSLPVCLLNRVPFDPWRPLSDKYVRNGWQRDCFGFYPPEHTMLWDWWA